MATHLTPIGKFIALARSMFSGGARIQGLEDDSLAAILINQTAKQRGVVPSGRLPFTVNPTAADTVTIGGHVFKFVASLSAATTFTQVKILGSAALTLAALLDAINLGGAEQNVNVVAATTPFAKLVTADSAVSGVLRLRSTTAQGNGVLAEVAPPSITLAASITAGGAWDCGNLNVTGRALEKQNFALIYFTQTAAMTTAGGKSVELGFTPTKVVALNGGNPAAFSISGNAVVVAPTDGGSTTYFANGATVAALAFE